MIFNCVYCDYKTSRKNSYLAHQRSNKHCANQKQYLLKFGVVPENHSEIEDTASAPNIHKPTTQKNSRSKINRSRSKSKNKMNESELEEIDQIDLNFDLDTTILEDTSDNENERKEDNDFIDDDFIDDDVVNDFVDDMDDIKDDNKEVIRLVSFSNMDDFYKTVSSSFLQQIRFFAEFELLSLNKSQQEAFDYIKKKYCYLDQEIQLELLKDLKLSLVVSNLIDDRENPLEINN